MQNKIFKFLIILFSSLALISSYKSFQSSSYQLYMIWDFNNNKFNTPYEIYATKLNSDYPNLTLTALPMSFIKARYYYNSDSLEIAKNLLYKAIEENPYIKAPEAMLANIYYDEGDYELALKYSKDAFKALPNNNYHRNIYFKTLSHFNDSIELENSFKIIKSYNNASHWFDYIIYQYKVLKKADENLLEVIEEFKTKYPNEENVENIERYVKYGALNFTLSSVLVSDASLEFENKNYQKALEMFMLADKFIDNPIIDLNIALTYDNLEDYNNAFAYFDRIINNQLIKSGKPEFHRGLLSIKLNNRNEGCKYLKQASDKNFIDSKSGLIAANVYYQLCKMN